MAKRKAPRVVEMEVMTVQRGGDGDRPKRGDLSRGLVRALEAVRQRRRERGMSPRADRVASDAVERVSRAMRRPDMEFTLEEAEGRPDMEFTVEEAEGRPRRDRVRQRALSQADRAAGRLSSALEGGSFGELRRRSRRNRGTGER